MYTVIPRPLLGLLLACAFAGCSGKSDPTSSGAVPRVAGTVAPAADSAVHPAAKPAASTIGGAVAGAESVQHSATMKTTLDCDDRSIVLEATCAADDGPLPECSAQTLAVVDRANGAVRSKREFDNRPVIAGDPPLVDEKISQLTCVKTSSNERYIVADMFNGGNCEECEWHELYDWSGALVGSDRNRAKPNATLTQLLRDSKANPDMVIAKTRLIGFYGKPLAN